MTETRQRYMLTPEEIAAMPGTQKVHFLNSNARRNNKSLGDAVGLGGFGFHLIEVPPGCDSTEQHRHLHEDECVYVLTGRARVTLDDETFDVGPGTFVGLPAGGPAHVFASVGDEPLRCLVVGSRLAHDVADYPRLGKRLFRCGGEWNLVDHADIVDPKCRPGSTAGEK